MRKLLELFAAAIPLVDRYPRWVAAIVAVWILFTAGTIIVLVLTPHKPASQPPGSGTLPISIVNSPAPQVYQAGRDIVINGPAQTPQSEPLAVRFHTSLTSGFPGPLMYMYHSKLGRCLAPVGYAVVIEVVNKSSAPLGIQDYTLDAAINGQWIRLSNLGAFDTDQFYWVAKGLRTSDRLDFTEWSFDRQAQGAVLQPGNGIRGWMFFEWPREYRSIEGPDIRQLRIGIETTTGAKQTVILDTHEPREPGASSLGGGFFAPTGQTVDLSDVRVLPNVDLREGIRTGTIR